MTTRKPAAKKAPKRAAKKPLPKKRKGRRESEEVRRARALDVVARLEKAIPDARVELAFENGWQLLVATILAAQNTDKNVNRVTPVLFKRWPTPKALAAAPQEEVEEVIKSTGFFRNKAKAIREMSRIVVEKHGGEAPRTLEELVELPGVARKTANVVMGCAFGIPSGIVVDTHNSRVSERLGLTANTDPVKIEQDLVALVPKEKWISFSHRVVLHGRYLCTAKEPDHARCPLFEICPSAEGVPMGAWEERAEREAQLVHTQRDESLRGGK